MPTWSRPALFLGAVVVIGISVTGCSAPANPSADAGVASAPASSATSTATPTPTTSTPAVANPDPVDLALRNKLTAMCDEMYAFDRAHQWENPNTYVSPTVDELAGVAAHLEGELVNRELTSRLAGLGTPTAGTGSWTRLVAELESYTKTTNEQITAAKAKDLPHYVETVSAMSSVDAKVREDLRIAGLKPTSTCMLLFTPTAGHLGQ
ncbi:MAG: hypothetical protein ABJA74_11945 [Lapillicoccus sp.]